MTARPSRRATLSPASNSIARVTLRAPDRAHRGGRRLTARFFLDAGNAEFPFVLGEYDSVVMPAAPPETIGLSGIGCGPYRIRFGPDPNGRSSTSVRPLLARRAAAARPHHAAQPRRPAGQRHRRPALGPVRRGDDHRPDRRTARSGVTRTSWSNRRRRLPLRGCNCRQHPGSPFMDRRVRQALAHAVDREAIVRLVYGPRPRTAGSAMTATWSRPTRTSCRAPRCRAPRGGGPRPRAAGGGRASERHQPRTLYWSPQTPEAGRYFQVLQENGARGRLTITPRTAPE